MQIAHTGLSKAVKSLILSHPLFAGILLQQRFAEDNSSENPTCSVDGETFAFNSAFCDSLSFDELKGVCAHEASHLALLHHARMGSRDSETWNQAADYAINARLQKDGFRLPKGALLDARFSDQSAEEIYRTLYREKQEKEKQDSQSKPQQGGQNQQNASGSGQPKPGQGGAQPGNGSQGQPSFGQVKKAKGDAKAAEAKAKGQVEKAVSIARMAGQLPGELVREIQANSAPRYDWREILHRFFQEITARDYSFSTPNKRFAHAGVILPSLRSRDMGRIVLAIDTSGSVSNDEVSAMVAEMQACCEAYTENGLADGLRVVYCDATVQGEETLFAGDKANPKGGGGTAFAPVFDHLAGDLNGAACLVYLTDGETSASDLAELEKLSPGFPVLWGLIKDNARFNPPFGEMFRLDIHA